MTNILLPSLIGLLGVIIGTVITAFISLKLKSKETKLRIIEKIFDKRIQAHENILVIIMTIRSVTSTEKIDESNNLISFPRSMTSSNSFTNYMNETFLVFHQNSHWLNTDLEREFGFLQDYFISLSNKLKNASDLQVEKIGILVKQDFIDLASSLGKIAFDFFREDIYNMKINKHDEWHKYPKEKTFERMVKTYLFTKKKEIDNILKPY